MAKLKKKPILLNSNTKLENVDGKVTVTGPKGSLSINLPKNILLVQEGPEISFKLNDSSNNIAILGLYHSLVNNALIGTNTGFEKSLELIGVGFRAATDGKKLTLNVGFTNPVNIMAPDGITFKVIESKIIVSGIDKYQVGEISAIIRRVKPPEPYKGKGIRYLGEKIRKKAGKAAKAVGGAVGAK